MSPAAPFDRDRDGDRLVDRARELRAEGLSYRLIAERLAAAARRRYSEGAVNHWLGHGGRPRGRETPDATPEEVAARAAEIRSGHAPPPYFPPRPAPAPDCRDLSRSSPSYRRLVRVLARGRAGA
jgi:hypothetical protein